MTYPDGYRYEGDWKAGSREGVGKATYPDGTVYTGNFKAGLRDGQGEIRMPDGFVYVGSWVAGEIEGTARPPIPRAMSTRAPSRAASAAARAR